MMLNMLQFDDSDEDEREVVDFETENQGMYFLVCVKKKCVNFFILLCYQGNNENDSEHSNDQNESNHEGNLNDEAVDSANGQPQAESGEDDVVFVNIPRETEHTITYKYTVDGKTLCEPCIDTYCRRNGIETYIYQYRHEVFALSPLIRTMHDEGKCDICSLGLMRVLGRRDCPVCYCAHCAVSDFPERCESCQRMYSDTRNIACCRN